MLTRLYGLFIFCDVNKYVSGDNLSPHLCCKYFRYPIMYAVEYGNANALISLLRRGANPNVVDKKYGYTPLMKALTDKYIPNRYLIIVLLLKNGTDVNIISRTSKTALYLAKLNHPRYVHLLKMYGAEY